MEKPTDEEVKQDYFPRTSRRNLRTYVDQRIIKNNTEAGKENELSSTSFQNYQNTFKEMTPAERNILVSKLAQENYKESINED